MTTPELSKKCPFRRPTTSDTNTHQVVIDIKMFRYCNQRSCLSAHGYYAIVALITLLFFVCSPSDVSGFVVTKIIDPINCKSGRAFADVLQECNEVFSPFSGNLNPQRPVVFEIPVFRIVTSTYHVRPRPISPALALAREAMPIIVSFCCQTATGSSLPQSEKFVEYRFLFSAIAHATGSTFTSKRFGDAQYNQSFKSGSGDKYGWFRHASFSGWMSRMSTFKVRVDKFK